MSWVGLAMLTMFVGWTAMDVLSMKPAHLRAGMKHIVIGFCGLIWYGIAILLLSRGAW